MAHPSRPRARGAGPWLVLLVLVSTAVPVRAQQVRAFVSADSVRVGERFQLSLVAVHEPAATPVFPTAGDSLRFGDLEVLSQIALTGYDRGGTRVDSAVYEVATFALDTAFVAPIPVRFAAGGDTLTARTEPFLVPVVSVVPPQAQGIRDLQPVVPFPAPLWPWILLALGLLLAGGLLAYYIRQRRRRPVVAAPEPERFQTPYEEAIERLARLETVDWTDAERIKEHYVDLTDLLRHYLARRTGVNAMEATTAELVRELHRRSALSPGDVARVRSLLDQGDFVKFADAHPSADRSRGLVAEARLVLDDVERDLKRREQPEAAPVEAA